jgi:cysteinyl-tRNA synthetase
VDLIFPHHEDEIAQSCAFTGEPAFARYWMHGEFLNIRGAKMSKRYGNVTTPRDLREDGVDPGAIRLLVYQTHYRQKLDLTDEALAAAREGSRRLGEFDTRLRKIDRRTGGPAAGWESWVQRLDTSIKEALDDDLNAPKAMAALFDAVREGNRLLDEGGQPAEPIRASWTRAVEVLDVLPGKRELILTPTGVEVSVETGTPVVTGSDAWALGLANERKAAKARRDYKEADRIRDLLKQAGWEIRDNKDGTVEVRRI